MSRGLGTIQREILGAMADDGWPTMRDGWRTLNMIKRRVWGVSRGSWACALAGRHEVLRAWHDGQETNHYSFRRALDSLVARGLLELRPDWRRGRHTPVKTYRITAKGRTEHSRLCNVPTEVHT